MTKELDQSIFNFNYLPEYADYILKYKLTEFITVGIRFCREVDLPLLKPLSRFSEQELIELSLESNKKMLEALSKNKTSEYVDKNIKEWQANTIEGIDKDEVIAEDLTVGFFIRRKTFAYFLDSYTKNVVEQKFIIAELDVFTTQEELFSYNVYIKMQQEKLTLINNDLNFHKELLLEAQELGGIGSFLLNVKDPSKSVYTPEYKKIFEFEGSIPFEEFMENVHLDDRIVLMSKINTAYKDGGNYEVEYRYKKGGNEKRIWSKGFVLSEEGKPILIRGIVREVNEVKE